VGTQEEHLEAGVPTAGVAEEETLAGEVLEEAQRPEAPDLSIQTRATS